MELTELKYGDKVQGCEEFIEQYFSPPAEDVYLYRTVHCPLETTDGQIQAVQEFPGLTRHVVTLPDVPPCDYTFDDKRNLVFEHALSFNVSEEQAVAAYTYHLNRRRTERQKEIYRLKKGTYVVRVRITPDSGLLLREPEPNGHTMLLESKGFSLGDSMDMAFGYKQIEDERNDG